jgi:hypothetical protein
MSGTRPRSRFVSCMRHTGWSSYRISRPCRCSTCSPYKRRTDRWSRRQACLADPRSLCPPCTGRMRPLWRRPKAHPRRVHPPPRRQPHRQDQPSPGCPPPCPRARRPKPTPAASLHLAPRPATRRCPQPLPRWPRPHLVLRQAARRCPQTEPLPRLPRPYLAPRQAARRCPQTEPLPRLPRPRPSSAGRRQPQRHRCRHRQPAHKADQGCRRTPAGMAPYLLARRCSSLGSHNCIPLSLAKRAPAPTNIQKVGFSCLRFSAVNRRSCLENAREHNSLRDSTNDPRKGSASQAHEPDANRAIAQPNVERTRHAGLFALG